MIPSVLPPPVFLGKPSEIIAGPRNLHMSASRDVEISLIIATRIPPLMHPEIYLGILLEFSLRIPSENCVGNHPEIIPLIHPGFSRFSLGIKKNVWMPSVITPGITQTINPEIHQRIIYRFIHSTFPIDFLLGFLHIFSWYFFQEYLLVLLKEFLF